MRGICSADGLRISPRPERQAHEPFLCGGDPGGSEFLGRIFSQVSQAAQRDVLLHGHPERARLKAFLRPDSASKTGDMTL
jgi:hypothetical protein